MHELLTMSACELARMIRTGEVRSLEVVETHIARVLEVNGRLNAMVADRFEDARREAVEADELVRTGLTDELPPLLGVPFTAKESFRVPGMPVYHLLSPEVTPFLTSNNFKTIWELLGGKFSGIRAEAQPDDRIVLTLIGETLWRKIQPGW